MHGNLDTQISDSLAPTLDLWLALPAAAGMLAPALLSQSDQTRLEHLRQPHRRQELLASRALLHEVGTGRHSTSLSHSGGRAALLTTDTTLRIGVDMEVHRPRHWLRLAALAFTARETAALHAAPQSAREAMFHALWTMKEAVAKALQLPLAQALTDCCFIPDASTCWQAQLPTDQPWCVQAWSAAPGITLAAACIGADQPQIHHWHWPPRISTRWPLLASANSTHA